MWWDCLARQGLSHVAGSWQEDLLGVGAWHVIGSWTTVLQSGATFIISSSTRMVLRARPEALRSHHTGLKTQPILAPPSQPGAAEPRKHGRKGAGLAYLKGEPTLFEKQRVGMCGEKGCTASLPPPTYGCTDLNPASLHVVLLTCS